MTTENRSCSFCGKPEHEVKNLIEGEHAYICNECVEACGVMLGGSTEEESGEEKSSESIFTGKLPTPAEIVVNLNDHVIGQEQAKKALAVAVYNHYKRLRHPKSNENVESERSSGDRYADKGKRIRDDGYPGDDPGRPSAAHSAAEPDADKDRYGDTAGAPAGKYSAAD